MELVPEARSSCCSSGNFRRFHTGFVERLNSLFGAVYRAAVKERPWSRMLRTPNELRVETAFPVHIFHLTFSLIDRDVSSTCRLCRCVCVQGNLYVKQLSSETWTTCVSQCGKLYQVGFQRPLWARTCRAVASCRVATKRLIRSDFQAI